MSAAVMVFPDASISARSTALRSSLMLPGQERDFSRRTASSANYLPGTPALDASCSAKKATRAGMSSVRSLSGGTSIGTTLRR